jgi:hypothetical protein
MKLSPGGEGEPLSNPFNELYWGQAKHDLPGIAFIEAKTFWKFVWLQIQVRNRRKIFPKCQHPRDYVWITREHHSKPFNSLDGVPQPLGTLNLNLDGDHLSFRTRCGTEAFNQTDELEPRCGECKLTRSGIIQFRGVNRSPCLERQVYKGCHVNPPLEQGY